MSLLTPKVRASIVDTFMANQAAAAEEPPVKAGSGKPTPLKCISCGGDTVTHEPLRDSIKAKRAAIGEPRQSKKARGRKKHAKAWVAKNKTVLAQTMVAGILGPPRFKCLKCGEVRGFYETMGRNLFKVEPLEPDCELAVEESRLCEGPAPMGVKPPYDGSQKARRYWKKVAFEHAAMPQTFRRI